MIWIILFLVYHVCMAVISLYLTWYLGEDMDLMIIFIFIFLGFIIGWFVILNYLSCKKGMVIKGRKQ